MNHQTAVSGVTDDDIRREFLAAGFTVKEGRDDLKPYVYDAAYRLLSLAQKRWDVARIRHLEADNKLAHDARREQYVALLDAQKKVAVLTEMNQRLFDRLSEYVVVTTKAMRTGVTPKGWRLVPEEPTEAMLGAPLTPPRHGFITDTHRFESRRDLRPAIYRAMLDAAPNPSDQPPQARIEAPCPTAMEPWTEEEKTEFFAALRRMGWGK